MVNLRLVGNQPGAAVQVGTVQVARPKRSRTKAVAKSIDAVVYRPAPDLPSPDTGHVTTKVRPSRSRSGRRSADKTSPQPRRLAHNEQIVPARSGDHPEIFQFLLAVFQGPSADEYSSQQDAPDYAPHNRMLLKRDGQIAAHAEIVYRTMLFRGRSLPTARLDWLGTLPELRQQGYATQLLLRCEQQMRTNGALIGTLRTRHPHFFRRTGWAICGRQSHSQAPAREVLARLSGKPNPSEPSLSLRLWRHVELPSLMRIYSQNLPGAAGSLVRSEEYWRWLISRKAFDHIVVAINGRDRMELVDTNAPIVGYAVVRQGQVIELLTSPDHPEAKVQLLRRVCGDTIERNRQSIMVEAPPADPIHQILVEAGGTFNRHESAAGEVQMVKLLDSAGWIQNLQADLGRRAREAALPATSELGFLVNGRKYSLTVRSASAEKSSAVLVEGRLGRSYLTLQGNEFTRLLLGHGDVRQAIEQERIVASTQFALEAASALFPAMPLWRPEWDDMPA
ncbi:MAG: GNAT family N-acetyltransferase [Planctomycetota bacterium]|nr:GNAT family N-acetyltransferase [Planctomycetota bacterium]